MDAFFSQKALSAVSSSFSILCPWKNKNCAALVYWSFFFFLLLEVRCWWFYHCVFEKSVGILLLSESKPDLFLDLIQRKLVAIK